jgi:hypothetical protein
MVVARALRAKIATSSEPTRLTRGKLSNLNKNGHLNNTAGHEAEYQGESEIFNIVVA